jgi:hypothetical protein
MDKEDNGLTLEALAQRPEALKREYGRVGRTWQDICCQQ